MTPCITNTIPLIKPDLPTLDEIRGPLEEILSNGRITNFGKYVNEFESETGALLRTHAVSTSSGTMGLLFTLSALGLKPGQKVIIPSFTFMATAQAVLYAGGIPVFAEIDDDLNMSPSDLGDLLACHEDVGAVIAVHMYGLPAKVDQIQEVVRQASERCGRKIPLIFDAAHAFGASFGGQLVGGFGDAEVFSLSVTKVLVSVEGGMVTTRNAELADRLKRMRNYGIQSNYDAHFPGMNGKMSEFHAILGLYNLRRISSLMDQRQTAARMYRDRIHRATSFRLTAWPEHVVHTFKDFTILVPEGHGQGTRDRLVEFLRERGVETRAYFFPPVHEQKHFACFATRPLAKTESLSRRVITLPFFTTISSEDMDAVVEALVAAEKEIL